MGPAEPRILSDCPPYLSCFPPNVYKILQNFIKFHQILQKLSKAYQLLEILPSLTKLYQTKVQISDLRNSVSISNCCNLGVFPPNLYPQNVMVEKKLFFFFPTVAGASVQLDDS